jgi:hypothetical protein
VDAASLVLGIVGLTVSLFTTVLAIVRVRHFWFEYRAAKRETDPGPLWEVELQIARHLFWGQQIRVVGYAAIFGVFASIFIRSFSSVDARAIRLALTMVVLVAFFSEENYLLRAKRIWAEMLKERRNGSS